MDLVSSVLNGRWDYLLIRDSKGGVGSRITARSKYGTKVCDSAFSNGCFGRVSISNSILLMNLIWR